MVHQGVAEPPASRRREIRAALAVVLAVLVVSALGGVVWAVLAPTERVLVVQPGRGAALTGESTHRFDAIAVFVCIAMVVGVLTAAAVWRLRRVRGPIMQCALLFASFVGAELMSWLGELTAHSMHPHASNPPLHTIVAMPPSIDGWRTLIDHWIHSDLSAGAWSVVMVQPLFAALVILLLAALSTSEDLGVGPDVPPGGNSYASDITYGPYGSPVSNGAALGHTGPFEGADSR
ncbi:DUF2567 domain-containing protein [Nocardia macrotermitis]|uniref:DUF2567 domain-containing protein n=1 Tax=Nocardia macrotermitis TaxID=2585198 RepID=A0A7K0D678_9NOCA|nr:DUF2567 domain-containing protein [Nocardia macrotermitis]MQY21229.1 hypothetical protein [Nocardia macrotermitis]